MTSPEIRYRRLLALYPRAHQEEYAEEMLTVLLADRRSGLGTTVDLVRSALAARFRAMFVDQGWRSAAHVVQVFGSILLLAIALRRVGRDGAVALFLPTSGVVPTYNLDYVGVGTWAVALIGALTGVRMLAVAGSLAGLAGEIAAAARLYPDTPAVVLYDYWTFVAAALVVLGGLMSIRADRVRADLLRGGTFVVAAGIVLVGNSFLTFSPVFDGLPVGLSYAQRTELLSVPAIVLVVIGVARLEPAIRRRVIAFAVPVLATFPLVNLGFAGFVAHNQSHPEAPALISPVQWAALVLIPVLAFAVAAELNRRLEESRFRAVTTGTSKAHE